MYTGTIFLLTDKDDSNYTDLIVFKDNVDKKDIINTIEEVKRNNKYYTDEDIYNALDKLGEYDVLWLGGLDIYMSIKKEQILDLIYTYSQSVQNDSYDEDFMNEFNVDNVAIDIILETFTNGLLEFMKDKIDNIEKGLE